MPDNVIQRLKWLTKLLYGNDEKRMADRLDMLPDACRLLIDGRRVPSKRTLKQLVTIEKINEDWLLNGYGSWQGKNQDSLVAQIKEVSKAMLKLQASGLNQKAIVALLHDSTKINKRTLLTVLAAIEQLAEDYCAPH